MTTVPTFRKWSKIVRAYGGYILAALCLIGGFAIVREKANGYVSIVPPCDQPCQDATSCDPLDFSFEVVPQRIKASQKNSLWYRARITNRSCRRLEGIYVKEFLDSKNLTPSVMGLWVAVSGQMNRPIDREDPPGPDGGIAWNYAGNQGVNVSTQGTIYPYQPNFELIDQLYRSKRIDEFSFANLRPGDSFASVPFRLRPYRIVATSVNSDAGITDGTARVNVNDPPSFPLPPEGFSLLDRYSFKQPGTYEIKAGYRANLRILPIFQHWERAPSWLKPILWKLGVKPPHIGKPNEREVNLVAPPITITVIE